MKAHRTDIVSFAFGLLFLGLSAWWLLAQLLGLVLPPVGWFLAGALILIGVLGLVGALRSGRSGATDTPETLAPAPDVVAPTSGQPAGQPAWDVDRTAGAVHPTLQDIDRTSDAFDPSLQDTDRTAGVDPTLQDIDRTAGGVDPTLQEIDRRDWEVSAPVSGRPAPAAGRVDRETADEWPTEAVSDRPVEAVEDRPAETDRPEPSAEQPGRGTERGAGPDSEPVSGPPAGEDRSRG